MEILQNLELMNKFLTAEEVAKVLTFYKNNVVVVEKHTALFLKDKWYKLHKENNALLKLTVCCNSLKEAHNRFKAKLISDEIFFDTFYDLRIWITDHFDRTGEVGIYELNWMHLHYNMQIFKIGRLQFQLGKYLYPLSYRGANGKARFLQKCLCLHIPRGENLLLDSAKDSIKNAREFFTIHFPDYNKCVMTCCSWLLSKNNANFMAKDCNILQFASLFEVVFDTERASDHLLWVCGLKKNNRLLMQSKRKTGKYIDTQDLPCNTSLKKSLFSYIEKGGQLSIAFGVVNI